MREIQPNFVLLNKIQPNDFYNFTIMDTDPSVGTYNDNITSIINSLCADTQITIVKGIDCP